jgi:digeranylgeranylglycerophospholipid reductase
MANHYDLAIAGGSFAGLVCARSAPLRGLRTLLLERQPAPGARVRTTGILVKEVAGRWEVPSRLVRRIRGVRLYSPSLSHIDLDSPGYYFLATDTARLMTWFAREAGQAGAELRFGRAYRGAQSQADAIELLGMDARAQFLVGADGPRSTVARSFGLGLNRQFLAGLEGEYVGIRGLDPDRLHCFIDRRLAPGYIGWAFIGVHGIAQIGLAARSPVKPDLDAFMTKLSRIFDLNGARLIGRRGGVIPVGGRVKNWAGERVLLAGDAAGIVSPLTAGGIHTALDSGWRAAHAIADHLMDGAPHPAQMLADAYPRFLWKRGLRRLFDAAPADWIADALISTKPLRAVAQTVYFHHRGLMSARAWSGLWKGDARHRANGG